MKGSNDMNLWKFIFMMLLPCLAGCGSSLMVKTTPLTDLSSQEKAMVIFMRPTNVAFGIQIFIWDGDRFLGRVEPDSMIQVLLDPGEHIFIGNAANFSIVKANLKAGKRYYLIARPIWPATVILDPRMRPDAELRNWEATLTPTAPEPEAAKAYSAKRIEAIRAALAGVKSGEIEATTMVAAD
jgi:hypothetical protein